MKNAQLLIVFIFAARIGDSSLLPVVRNTNVVLVGAPAPHH